MKRFIIAVMFATMAVFATDARATNIGDPVPFPVVGIDDTFFFINALHNNNSPSPFTDTFIFSGVNYPVLADASLITNLFNSNFNIHFQSVTLNGQALTLGILGGRETADTPILLNLSGPVTLVVTGTAGSNGGQYSGPVTLTAVPEPASLMMLGAGLAGIGIWRRKAAKV